MGSSVVLVSKVSFSLYPNYEISQYLVYLVRDLITPVAFAYGPEDLLANPFACFFISFVLNVRMCFVFLSYRYHTQSYYL